MSEPGSRKPLPGRRLILKLVNAGEVAPRYCNAASQRSYQESRLLDWLAEPDKAILFRKDSRPVLTAQWVICEGETETNEWGEVAP